MIVFFELDLDCKQGVTLEASGNRSLRAYAGRILAKCSTGVIVHRDQGKVIKRRRGAPTYRVEHLADIVAGL